MIDDAIDTDTTISVPAPGAARPSIGPYRLLEKVGEGGMGEVWLAEQRQPVRRQVALKVIKAGMDTAQVVARFEAERQALALMEHPAIATVFDGGSTPEGRPFFVMEYVKGEPITRYCDRQRMTTQERLRLLVQVCEGVQHAHVKGVIHRDLKPSNVLVTLQDERPVPKIIDFGVAKATLQHLTERTLVTERGSLIGTLEYMSPEQAELTGLDIDTRTDVYALGVLLYELLTGVLPFDAKAVRRKGLEEIRRTIREVEPPRPSARVTHLGVDSAAAASCRQTDPARLARQLRGDLDWITLKALEKDRIRRYQTAAALAADVQHHLRHEPVTAGPPSTVYRAGKFVRRHRIGVTFSVVTAAVLVLGTVGTGIGLVRARRAERAAVAAAAKTDAINSFLLDTLAAPNPVGGRRDATVLDALRGAEDKLHSAFPGQPEVEAAVWSNIGVTYERLGFYADAERVLRQALEVCHYAAGVSERHCLVTEQTLAVVLHDQGRLAEAEGLYREVLSAGAGVLEAQALTGIKGNLALLLSDKGEYAAAEALSRDVVAADREQLDGHAPDLAVSLSNLAKVLQKQGRPDEALVLYREADAILATAANPFRCVVMGNIGELECEKGHETSALPLLREGVSLGTDALGEGHPDVVSVREKLSACLLRGERFEEAENELLAALAALGSQPAAGSRQVDRIRATLVELYDAWGRSDKAAEWRETLETAGSGIAGGGEQ